MKVTESQHKFMIELIEQLEAQEVDELVFDMNLKNGAKNYVFKYAMCKGCQTKN